MIGGRLGVLAALAALGLALAIAGCGASSSARSPDLRSLPLVPGVSVTQQTRQCDRGASAYCALELVVVDRSYATSAALVSAERSQLRKHGWTGTNADTSDERAADSPGQKLRVTYATAFGEAKGIALLWIKRSHATALALSRELFDRSPAMALLLEVGPA